MKKVSYVLVKEKKYSKFTELHLENAYNMKKKMGKENLGLIKFYDAKMVSKILKKAFDGKFKKLLEFIVEADEESDPDGLLLALNEADKFRKEINNKYARYLDKKQKEFNEKKIALIENDLKNKLMAYRYSKVAAYMSQAKDEDYEMDEEIEERHRRR